jgi:inner membrane protein
LPLPVAHGLVGVAVAAAVHPRPFARRCSALLFAAALANCPDLDFILVYAFHERGWHRGFTHSLAFALAVGFCLLAALGWRRRMEALAYFLALASHGLLDYATTRLGGGVELLWPFTSERYALRAFGLSELPSHVPPEEILRYALLETLIFVPPFLVVYFLRRRAGAAGVTRR